MNNLKKSLNIVFIKSENEHSPKYFSKIIVLIKKKEAAGIVINT